MFQERKGKDTLEDATHRLYGCLAQSILVFVLIANILAYVLSSRYRSTFPFWKFLLATLAWAGLTAGFWWVRRSLARMKGPFREGRPDSAGPRPPTSPGENSGPPNSVP